MEIVNIDHAIESECDPRLRPLYARSFSGVDIVSRGAGETIKFAAQVAAMDLVVTIDNSTAHRAAALGVPVWLLLPFAPDWRWLLDRKDSLWYPTMRLFRQVQPHNWRSVIEQVHEVW